MHQLDIDGREIVLYRLRAGDTCILNTAALLSSQQYAAYAITETEVEADLLPVSVFDTLIATAPGFRAFIFRSHAARIGDLMRVIRDLAFERIDTRLARRLLELADNDGRVTGTHANFAVEIGSAREVVSRQLKSFERNRWVSLGKGELTLVDIGALGRLAHHP